MLSTTVFKDWIWVRMIIWSSPSILTSFSHVFALLLRRSQPSRPQVLRFADLSLDTGTRQAYRGDRTITLTAKEYELLELFMRHPRQVLTRDMIFDRVWGYDFGGESNIIEVYMRYLRQKLETDEEPRLLHTVRGMGYVLREPS
jgi:two-component system, OmpR family, response regulator MprA